MSVIEIGDTVEVINDSYGGHEVGSICEVVKVRHYRTSKEDVLILKGDGHKMLWHAISDVILIKKEVKG